MQFFEWSSSFPGKHGFVWVFKSGEYLRGVFAHGAIYTEDGGCFRGSLPSGIMCAPHEGGKAPSVMDEIPPAPDGWRWDTISCSEVSLSSGGTEVTVRRAGDSVEVLTHMDESPPPTLDVIDAAAKALGGVCHAQ